MGVGPIPGFDLGLVKVVEKFGSILLLEQQDGGKVLIELAPDVISSIPLHQTFELYLRSLA